MSVFMFPGGRLEQAVTSIALVNNTVKTVDTTVPTSKRWKLLSVKATNPDNVARVFGCKIYKEAALTNKIRTILSKSMAAAEELYWPNGSSFGVDSDHFEGWCDIVLDAGNTINCVWATGGASAGGTDADGLVIEYLEMPV